MRLLEDSAAKNSQPGVLILQDSVFRAFEMKTIKLMR